MKFQDKLQKFPPIVCRLFASKLKPGQHRKAKSDEEIAADSGLPMHVVKGLTWKLTWEGVPVEHVFAFLTGCGIDLDDSSSFERWSEYRKKAKVPRHARHSAVWKTFYRPLMDYYFEELSK